MSVRGETSASAGAGLPDWPGAGKEALIAGVITLALAVPILGLQTVDAGGGTLGINYRWAEVGIAAAVVAVGRFLLAITRPMRRSWTGEVSLFDRAVDAVSPFGTYIGIVGVIFAFLLPFMVSSWCRAETALPTRARPCWPTMKCGVRSWAAEWKS